MLNGYGDAFNYCNSSLYDVIDCQKAKIDNFQVEMVFLLFLGILVLGICVGIITPFCYSTIKIENNFWNKIRQNASDHYFELTQSSLERLVRVHNQPEIELNSKSPSKTSFDFRNYWKYIWRVLLYFFVVLAFSLINILYLYQQCVDYLSYRPEIIRELIQSRILYSSLGVWTSEVAIKNIYVSDEDKIKYSLPFKNDKIWMEETINKIKHAGLQLRKSKYSSILSEEIKKTLYEYADNSIYKELAYGIYSAGEMSIMDNNFVSYGGKNIELWLHQMILINELNINYDELVTEADHYSESVVNRQITIIVWVLTIFIVISFLMYFGLYLRFFNEEKKSLSKMHTIMEIMP
ncbi:unnamed protein product [Blepharisma stoltei]|uniref:Uncharacterized protein n=1 Tax=Blepharisma stoltei TaxID=1481888 RepID=A0AAU9JDW1_9CILI|nr:unnamed protein product [Blepharisma stoltei]